MKNDKAQTPQEQAAANAPHLKFKVLQWAKTHKEAYEKESSKEGKWIHHQLRELFPDTGIDYAADIQMLIKKHGGLSPAEYKALSADDQRGWLRRSIEAEWKERGEALDPEALADEKGPPLRKVPWDHRWGKQSIDLCEILLAAGSGGITEAELKGETRRQTSKILGDWKKSGQRHKVKLAKEIEAEKRKSKDGKYRLPKKYLTP